MRFLVLGASGMAGHIIAIYLKERGHIVDGFARRDLNFVNTIVGDATDFNFLSSILKNQKYDSVINAIGILNGVAEENKDKAILLNGYLPHFLAKETENTDTQIIHMSTDCVFSGAKGNYVENDFQDGSTFYDRTKAIGELEDNKNITLRNSIVGPDINPQGIGLFNWFMKQKGDVQGYTHAMWNGLTSLQLAKFMEKAATKKISGLYHMVPNESISKFELLKLFNRYARDENINIIPCDKVVLDKTLKRTDFSFNENVPTYEEMVAEMVDWIKNHKELYPQYDI